MAYEINYSRIGIGIKDHPYYQKYSVSNYNTLTAQKPLIVSDLQACFADDESTEVVAYLSGLLRVIALLA